MKFSRAFSSVGAVCLVALLFGSCSLAAGDSSPEPLAVQNGSDLILNTTENGPLEVVFGEDGQLVFEVCPQSCDGEVLLCFEGAAVNDDSMLSTNQCESKCGFFVNATKNQIGLMDADESSLLDKNPFCLLLSMVQGISVIKNAETDAPIQQAQTCKPKVEDGGYVKLMVKNVSSACPVSIKNATLKPEPTTTPTTPSTTGTQTLNAESSSTAAVGATTEAPSFFSSYWWVFLLAVLLALILVGGIFLAAYFFIGRKAKNQNDPTGKPQKKEEKIDSIMLPPSQRSALFSTKDGLPEHHSQQSTDLRSVKPQPEADAAKKCSEAGK